MNEKILKNPLFFFSCPTGIEEFLVKELKEISENAEFEIQRGGIELYSSFDVALKLMLHTQVASRVFLQVYTADVQHEDHIYEQSQKFEWENLLTTNDTFKLSVQFLEKNDLRVPFRSTQFAMQRMKDGIADRFRNKFGSRPSVDKLDSHFHFMLVVKPKTPRVIKMNVFWDLTLSPLSHRGYRLGGHEAPLRENLAGALSHLTNWNPELETLIDPMAGTGTLIIENMIRGLKISPQFLHLEKVITAQNIFTHLQNHSIFSFFHQDCLKIIKDKHVDMLQKLKSAEENRLTVFVSDTNPKALDILKKTMSLCKFTKFIEIKRESFFNLTPQTGPGVLVMNPPYGVRLDSDENLAEMYYQIGEKLKKDFKGFRAYIFCQDPELRKKIELKTSKRFEVRNGNLDCRILEYKLY